LNLYLIVRLTLKGSQFLFQKEQYLEVKICSTISRNSRKEFIRTDNEREIELQMDTMLEFKYYGDHVMSRKFK
jgi:hypothetical protein